MGSLWLCREHKELVEAEYALGEGGVFNIHPAGKEFFTIQVAEKGVCWVKARTQGEPGHGSMPRSDSAVVKLAEAIAHLGKQGLPMRATKPAEECVMALAQDLPGPIQKMLPKLLQPAIAPKIAGRDPRPGRGPRLPGDARQHREPDGAPRGQQDQRDPQLRRSGDRRAHGARPDHRRHPP